MSWVSTFYCNWKHPFYKFYFPHTWKRLAGPPEGSGFTANQLLDGGLYYFIVYSATSFMFARRSRNSSVTSGRWTWLASSVSFSFLFLWQLWGGETSDRLTPLDLLRASTLLLRSDQAAAKVKDLKVKLKQMVPVLHIVDVNKRACKLYLTDSVRTILNWPKLPFRLFLCSLTSQKNKD